MEPAAAYRIRHPRLIDRPVLVEAAAPEGAPSYSATGSAWGTLKESVPAEVRVVHEGHFCLRESVATSFWDPSAADAGERVAHKPPQDRDRPKCCGGGPSLWYSIPSQSVEELFGLAESRASNDGIENAPLAWSRRREQRVTAALEHFYRDTNGSTPRLRTSPTTLAPGHRGDSLSLGERPPLFDVVKYPDSVALLERPAPNQLSPGRSGERKSCKMQKCFDTSPSLASVPTTAEFLTPLGVRWGARKQPPFPHADGLGPHSTRTFVCLGATGNPKKQETVNCVRRGGDSATDTPFQRLQRVSITSGSLLSVFSGSSVASMELLSSRDFERSNRDLPTTLVSDVSNQKMFGQREVGGVYFDENELVEAAALLADVVRENSAAAEHAAKWRETLDSVRDRASDALESLSLAQSRGCFADISEEDETDSVAERAVKQRKDVTARTVGLLKDSSAQWTCRSERGFHDKRHEVPREEKKKASLMQSIVTRLIELLEQIVLHPNLLSTSESCQGHCDPFSTRLLQLLRVMRRLPLEQKEMTLTWLECWMCLEKALQSDRHRRKLSRTKIGRVLRKGWERSDQSISRCSTTSSKKQFHDLRSTYSRHRHIAKHRKDAKTIRSERAEEGFQDAFGLVDKKADATRSPKHGWSAGCGLPGSGDFFAGHGNCQNKEKGDLSFRRRGSTSSSPRPDPCDFLMSLLSYQGFSDASSLRFPDQFHRPLKSLSPRSDYFSVRSLSLPGTPSDDLGRADQCTTNFSSAEKGLLESEYGAVSIVTSTSSNRTSSRPDDERISIVPRLALGDVGAGSWLGGEKTSGETYVAYDHTASNANIDTGSPAEFIE